MLKKGIDDERLTKKTAVRNFINNREIGCNSEKVRKNYYSITKLIIIKQDSN